MGRLEGLRERALDRKAAAASTYEQLVVRVAAGKLTRADTPAHVEELLAAAGRTPEELAADVELVQGHARERDRARPALDVQAAEAEAVGAFVRARHELNVETRRLRAAAEGARSRSLAAASAAEDVASAGRAILTRVPEELAQRYNAAAAAWRSAASALQTAQAEAEGWRSLIVRDPTAKPPACDPDTLRRLAGEVVRARDVADAAWAAVLAYEPPLSALKGAREAFA